MAIQRRRFTLTSALCLVFAILLWLPSRWPRNSLRRHRSHARSRDLKDREGRTALHYACTTQSSKCVSAIAKHAASPDDLSVADGEGLTPLVWLGACSAHVLIYLYHLCSDACIRVVVLLFT
jgi:hypothetical protein